MTTWVELTGYALRCEDSEPRETSETSETSEISETCVTCEPCEIVMHFGKLNGTKIHMETICVVNQPHL